MSRRMIGVDARTLAGGVDTVPPNPPPSLAASSITTTTATITWSASTDASGIGGYNVYDATGSTGGGGGTPPVLLGSTIPSVRTYNLTTLASGQNNTIQVTAFDAAPAANESDPSSITITTTGATDVTAPSVPTGLTAGVITPTSIDLSWAASSDDLSGVDHYIVLVNAGSPVNNIDTSYTVTGLTASTSYTLTVKAVDGSPAANTSAASAGLVVSTSSASDVINPSQVTGLSIDSVGATTVALSWTAATDNSGTIASYKVWWNGQAGGTGAPTALLHTNTGSQLSYTATGLNPSTTYRFAVSATDPSTNEGAKSGTVPATTSAVSGGTGILFGLQATGNTGNQTQLGARTAANGWTSSTGGVLVDGSGNSVGLGSIRNYMPAGTFPAAFAASHTTGGFGTNTHKRCQNTYKGNGSWTSFQGAAQGGGDSAYCTFVNSIPAGWEVAMVYHHEPNGDFDTGANTPEWYRQAQMRFGALLENRSMPSGQAAKTGGPAVSLASGVKVHNEICFTSPRSATDSHWAQVQLALPHANLMDANAKLCVDAYQNPPPPISGATYPTGATVLGYFINNILAQFGYDTNAHGWTIGEWMAPLRDGDTSHAAQAAAVDAYLTYCENLPRPPYCIYMWEDFNSVSDAGAQFVQKAWPATKQAFVNHALGSHSRV